MRDPFIKKLVKKSKGKNKPLNFTESNISQTLSPAETLSLHLLISVSQFFLRTNYGKIGPSMTNVLKKPSSKKSEDFHIKSYISNT